MASRLVSDWVSFSWVRFSKMLQLWLVVAVDDCISIRTLLGLVIISGLSSFKWEGS